MVRCRAAQRTLLELHLSWGFSNVHWCQQKPKNSKTFGLTHPPGTKVLWLLAKVY
ncbi:hypothetical protein COO91_07233 [Nostoc flagelliforme CCNUN1]|uniref:Uncharacterized protein n=1 Tax=Nostoc flagelliforme CCNUN1 TaxID=2038116 RepID=A0A2K8T0F5_9NOSO|nr:hypothetical protein COO91_07233 [Nostoc flagelliforme CCNUN1]